MIKSFFIKNFPKLGIKYRNFTKYGYEPEMDILNTLVNGKNSIDVGAHLGNYTYKLSNVSTNTYAFEPNIFLSCLLEEAKLRNTHIYNVALSTEIGFSTLKIPEINGVYRFGNAFLGMRLASYSKYYELAVKTMPLDGYELQNIGFIKIDVEGHEIQVIKGAIQTIEQSYPTLLVEINDNYAENIIQILSILGNKYEAVVLNNKIFVKALDYYKQHKRIYNNNVIFLKK